jgi:hypothetical protein
MQPEQSARITAWVKDHWKHGPCPVCKENSWAFAPDLVSIAPIAGPYSGRSQNRGMYVMAPVNCQFCGYTIFINASVGKIWLPGEPTLPEGFSST